MLSGDKTDQASSNSPTSNDKSGDSKSSNLDNLIESPIDNNLDQIVNEIDLEINRSSIELGNSNEKVNARKLVIDIETRINDILKQLSKVRSQNKQLENLIEESKKSLASTQKSKSTIGGYFENFDKYFVYASNILTKILQKFNKKVTNNKKSPNSIFNNLTEVGEGSVNIKTEHNPITSNTGFISFLKINRIHDLVENMSAIGHGGEGRVYRAILKATNDPVVVKSYFMDCEQSSRIEYAMLVLCHNVRGVKKPIGLFQSSANYYLVMEDDHKSIPLDVLAEKGILTENQIQHLFSQMVYILYELRNKFIKHRDVKLDNFLLNTETGRLSIIDFGWAMYTALDQVLIEEVKRSGETLMGTFDYLPPEADSKPGTVVSYDKATVYALGCILMELFFGYQGKVRNILAKETLHDFVNRISLSKCRTISKGALSILDRCLKNNVKDRLGLDEVILHPWVPSDKVDNSLFKNFNKPNIPNTFQAQNTNTSLPSNLNRPFSLNSQ